MITDQQKEIFLIAQEECAEVTQAISKIFRFGLDGEHLDKSNRERLTEEVGDLMCMLNLMDEFGLVDWNMVSSHAQNKRKKLQKWSNIFGEKSE